MAAVISAVSTPCFSAIPQTINFITYNMSLQQTSFVRDERGHTELDLSYIRQLSQLARNELKMSAADFIPSGLKNTDSEIKVAQQIIGHSLERWFSSSEIANGAIGDAIRTIEEPMAQSMDVRDSSGRHHKVAMNVKASRAIASVTYTGVINATLAYQVTSRTIAFEAIHKLKSDQKIVFNSTSHPQETRQMIAWQMSW